MLLVQTRRKRNHCSKKNAQFTVIFDKYNGSLSTSTEQIETLVDKIVHLNSNMLLHDHHESSISQSIYFAERAILLEKSQIDAMSVNQDVLMQDSLSLKQQIENETSKRKQQVLDGTNIWKISQVREKINDSESERQPSIYSPPFYTSTTGYKLSSRLYLNGDGTARGTHMSLFLVILQGEFDSLLQWPFSYQVTFCLFDQRAMITSNGSNQPEHVIGSFRPDIKSISFQRPRSAISIASGIPKFLPLERLHVAEGMNRYIINDTMFIKVFIDFLGVPKTILPFIFNLNVALPIHVQQKLIDEKIKLLAESNNT